MTVDFGIDKFQSYIELVDKKLNKQAPKNIRGTDRLLAASGKRLRPGLVIAVAYYSGKEIDENVVNAASAVEMVHLASLIHDDIMDSGKLRWGLPTINSKEGDDWAILAGDYLLAKGCALAASVSAEAGRVLSETIASLCEGQAIELNDRFNTDRTTETLIQAAEGKTSSLFMAAVNLGGIVAGLAPGQIRALTGFARNFGIAYQCMDDISDFIGSAKSAGKSVGNDIREGNYTLPVILSLDSPHKNKLIKLLGQKDVPTTQIVEILNNDKSLEFATNEAKQFCEKAIKELNKLDIPRLAEILKLFAEQNSGKFRGVI